MAMKLIRQWRVSQGEPFGLHVWFDPKTEVLRLYEIVDPPVDPGVLEVSEGDDYESPEDAQVKETEVSQQGDLPF